MANYQKGIGDAATLVNEILPSLDGGYSGSKTQKDISFTYKAKTLL